MSFSELSFHHKLFRPGTIVDVGANVGTFSMHFSTWLMARLWAFEPFPPTFSRLEEALKEGHKGQIPDRVILKMGALGSNQGVAKLRVPRSKDGLVDQWASLAKTFEDFEGVTYEEVDIPLWTLDGFRIDDLTALKVDAEGFEQEVLQGAVRTIQRSRPIISCELEERHRQGCTWYVPGFMAGLGYDGFYFYKDEFWPIDALDRETMQVASKSVNDNFYSDPYIHEFYFVPRENAELRFKLSEFGRIRG